MRLWAIADLHLGAAPNREALRALPSYPADWLILAGDVCEDSGLFAEALGWLARRFARVVWAPGNHELWLGGRDAEPRNSVAKYAELVTIARRHGVATPEDPFPVWPGTGEVIVPLLTLYDYSFRPEEVPLESVVPWAAETSCVCADEQLIRTAPFKNMPAWCEARCAEAETRMASELPGDARTVLVSHFPLRRDLVRIPRIPRFVPWCGTRRTEDWHRRFRAATVISGHLHARRTDWRDGTLFEEVSLGYPSQWDQAKSIAAYLREIRLDHAAPS